MQERQIGKTKLRLVVGDIAEQDTDAVVTAAHWRLNKGMGTDGTIHSKGGPEIYEECKRIGGCPIGDAVITTGGKLKARYVIHAVGPVWRGGDEHEPELLASAYRRSLQVAAENGLRSISIPSISTGAFCYPIRAADQLHCEQSSTSCSASRTILRKFGWCFTRARMTWLIRSLRVRSKRSYRAKMNLRTDNFSDRLKPELRNTGLILRQSVRRLWGRRLRVSRRLRPRRGV
jgi:O-acetyl-ADP-ribose deacetylase (regulator of RNase III)